MFYSQTFLARKGPLGTVWCAAHLQHRLKKSHYTSTDISSTVDHIMFPEVPIALRMSGHLLLGVVRIYSKKVDYLYHDCNVVLISLRKAFASIEVNLPEHATTAKFESVTLPQTFDLDAFDVDFDVYSDGSLDNHMRSEEEITLQDQIPTGRDLYVAIPLDEDFMMDTLPPGQDTDIGVRAMEEDILPPSRANSDVGPPHASPSNWMEEPEVNVGLQDPSPSTRTEVHKDTVDIQEPGTSNQTELQSKTSDFQDPGPSNQTKVLNSEYNDDNSLPEFEVLRDNVPAFSLENLHPVLSDHQNGVSEPHRSLDQVLDGNEIPSQFKEDNLPSGVQFSPFQQRLGHPNAVDSHGATGISDSHMSFRHTSPELAIRSTPPVQQPRRRPRKRNNFFDESTVLTNKFMKKALENSNDILRKRREIPATALGTWKWNNILRKEQVFYEPSLTGSCAELCNLLKKDYMSTKPHLTLEKEAAPEPRVATSLDPATEVIFESRDDASYPAPAIKAIAEPRNATASDAEDIPQPTVAQPPQREIQPDPEIECLRHYEGPDGNSAFPEFQHSAATVVSSGRFLSSLSKVTPSLAKSIGSETVHWTERIIGTEVLSTPDFAVSASPYAADLEMNGAFLLEQFDAGQTGLSEVPEINTAGTEDLYFLEADDSPAGSQGTEGISSLSVRTRAVAQYLKRHSPSTPVSEDQPEDLSLNKILQGKTRKLCARMFFETLVLKSHQLIDVQQDQPYGDITLKLTSRLSKAQI